MAPAFRCLLLAAGILGLAPGTASAAATVELNQVIGVLEITGDVAADDLTTLQSATELVVTRHQPDRRSRPAPAARRASPARCRRSA